MQTAGKTLLFCALTCFLAACGTHQPAPVEEHPPLAPKAPPPVGTKPAASPAAVVEVPTYTVKKGDTLYFIALDHGQDYKDIAAWNNIEHPDRISVGQVLKVGPPTGAAPAPVSVGPAQVGVVTPHAQIEARPIGAPGTPTAAASTASPANATGANGAKNWPKTGKEAYSDQAAGAAANATTGGAKPGTQVAKADAHPDANASDDDKVDWGWPVHGKMLGGFSESTNKGIDISAKTGDPVAATASGKVVYSGSGLRGYGKLIVIKHNATYFSAYAHNNEILVKEGQLVVKGQKIAEVGSTDAEQPMLHFEIRKQGKPVDPLKYLPSAG
jgi:lipoprotein NlpD